MKIFVVGPIFPYRGGIAHSNRALCENLGQRHEVTAISFSRQYPKLFFPGKEQKEKGEDPSFKVKTEYVLDSINPFNWLQVGKRIAEAKPDWVVFQWWHTGFAPCYWALALKIKKNHHTRISVLCHNFLPHDRIGILQPFHFFFAKTFFRLADCIATFSSGLEKEIQQRFPSKRIGWFIEPPYEQGLGKKASVSPKAVRKELGLEGKVILFFGFVRSYKGLEYLLEALPGVLERVSVTLLVAGEFWKDKQSYLDKIRRLGLENQVRIFDQYIPNERVEAFFHASDVLVLPYVSSTNSAVLKMALGFGTPVISTRVGSHEDLVEDQKTGLLVEPKNPDALANAILLFFEKKLGSRMRREIAKKKELFEWTPEKEKILFNTIGSDDTV